MKEVCCIMTHRLTRVCPFASNGDVRSSSKCCRWFSVPAALDDDVFCPLVLKVTYEPAPWNGQRYLTPNVYIVWLWGFYS